MTRNDELNKLADDYVRENQSEQVLLEGEANELRAKLRTIEAKLSGLKDIAARRRGYKPETNQIPNCPYCSIDQNTSVPLLPQSSETAKDEWLCRECRAPFSLSPP
jgi:hypothetical protein